MIELAETPFTLEGKAIALTDEAREAFALAGGRAISGNLFEMGELIAEVLDGDRCTLAEFSDLGGDGIGDAIGGRQNALGEIPIDVVEDLRGPGCNREASEQGGDLVFELVALVDDQ